MDDLKLIELVDQSAAVGRDVAAGLIAAGPGGAFGPGEGDDSDAGGMKSGCIIEGADASGAFDGEREIDF